MEEEVKRPFSIYVRDDLRKRIEAAARAEGRSISNYVEWQMERHLSSQEVVERRPKK